MKENQNDEYGQLHQSGLHSTGRIIINLWRALRSELKLNIYTFESCVAAVLQLQVPHIPAHELAQWYTGGASGSPPPFPPLSRGGSLQEFPVRAQGQVVQMVNAPSRRSRLVT